MKLSKNIFFTIIIPCYNSEKTIQRCIESVLIQNFKKIEILVINDCSKDKTLNKLKKYKEKIEIINNKKNFGVGYSRNKAIDKANGKYIIFLDADDILIKNKLKNLYSEINKYKKIDFLIGQHNINKDGYLYKKNINNKTISNKLGFINNLDKFYGYCWRFIISKSYLDENQLKFSNARIFEDEEFVAKLIMNVKNFYFSKISFYFHSEGSGTLSSSKKIRDIKSIITILNNLNNYSYKKRLSKHKITFLHSRINIVFSHFITLVHIINNVDLDKLSVKFNQKISNKKLIFSSKNKEKLDRHWLKKYIKNDEKKLIDKLKNYKLKKFIIFCFDRNGMAVEKILKKYNFKIKGFLDNKEIISNTKINVKLLKFFEIEKDDKIIITNQRNEHINQIKKQLVDLNVPKKNIFIKKFGNFD